MSNATSKKSRASRGSEHIDKGGRARQRARNASTTSGRAFQTETVKAATRLLRKVFGSDFIMPMPAELPDQSRQPPAPGYAGRQALKADQLQAVAVCFSFFVLIENSERKAAYYKCLRKHNNVLRRDGDKVAWILRSVIRPPAILPLSNKIATDKFSTWATAIRYCVRKKIPPNQVILRGMRPGEGISVWAAEERRWRKKMKDREAQKEGLHPIKVPKPFLSVTAVARKLQVGERALVEVERTGRSSPHVVVIRTTKLPHLISRGNRQRRWQGVKAAAHDKSNIKSYR